MGRGYVLRKVLLAILFFVLRNDRIGHRDERFLSSRESSHEQLIYIIPVALNASPIPASGAFPVVDGTRSFGTANAHGDGAIDSLFARSKDDGGLRPCS